MKKFFTLVFPFFMTVPVFGQWSSNSTLNNSICTAAGDKINQNIISDGNGGSFIAWSDGRNGSYNQIYIQKISASGILQWTTNGVPICPTTSTQNYPHLVSDGAGGAIVIWADYRNNSNVDVYAQKINAAGNVLWSTNGVAVYGGTGGVQAGQIATVSDGVGGAIITWNDDRNHGSTFIDIYAQRLNTNGVALWIADGVLVSNASNAQTDPQIISDGLSGAIITWTDFRNSATTYYDIYAQRINASGATLWTSNGVVVCNAQNTQTASKTIDDGSGGVIIVWLDARNFQAQSYQLYAQHINSSGVSQWANNGISVCDPGFEYENFQMLTSDASGGVIISWNANRGSGNQLYGQRLNSGGGNLWVKNGIAISTVSSDMAVIISDGLGGAIIAWRDSRNGFSDTDIYAQKVNSMGQVQWPAGGNAICKAINLQSNVQLVSDGNGGAVGTWIDFRNGSNNNLYASRIYNLGTLPISLTSFTAALKNKQGILNWVTASETNNKGFDVESSADGKSFQQLGFVTGYGTSTQQQLYKYTDAQLSIGKNFYRLKQIDVDGKYAYSNVVEVNNMGNGGSLQVYPNPAINTITIINSGITATVQITDMAGRVLRTTVIGGSSTTLYVGNLSAGSYICRAGGNSVMFLKK